MHILRIAYGIPRVTIPCGSRPCSSMPARSANHAYPSLGRTGHGSPSCCANGRSYPSRLYSMRVPCGGRRLHMAAHHEERRTGGLECGPALFYRYPSLPISFAFHVPGSSNCHASETRFSSSIMYLCNPFCISLVRIIKSLLPLKVTTCSRYHPCYSCALPTLRRNVAETGPVTCLHRSTSREIFQDGTAPVLHRPRLARSDFRFVLS